jgi:hypothetical protein
MIVCLTARQDGVRSRSARCQTEGVPEATVYVLGPIVAFLVIGALAAILRWSSDPELKRKQAEIFAGPADYGLLAVVAVVDTAPEARVIQLRLSDAGIRATVSPSGDGRMNVLVFDAEQEAARRVVGGSPI